MSDMTEISQPILVPEESDNDKNLNIKSPLLRTVSSLKHKLGFYD